MNPKTNLNKNLQAQNNLASKSAREWVRTLTQYREPSHTRSWVEISATAIPFLTLWLFALFAYSHNYWVALACIIPAAGFLTRLFAIQHDCGHGTLFRHKLLNDWIGRVLGVFTFTPYDVWKKDHAEHHSCSGNLDRRGNGDITTLTVDEYKALSYWGRLSYRLYRQPIFMLLFGPAYIFLIRNRLPFGRMNEWKSWLSSSTTNLATAALITLVIWFFGLKAFLFVQLPMVLASATLGVWLFYVQHQYEGTTWKRDNSWDPQEAALFGSSYYDLPFLLRWITADIGAHHIHHLYSRIPYYHFQKILREHPQLRDISRITLWQSLKSLRLRLWDEAQQKMVSFREIK